MSSTYPVYLATYSAVPVYEYRFRGIPVMRRRDDDYVNATHILKIADFDKPQRTKILERDVHTQPHEKIQGGYGKYQGTWVTLERAKAIATRFGVYDDLKPLLELDTTQELPAAPKHRIAATSMTSGTANATSARGRASARTLTARVATETPAIEVSAEPRVKRPIVKNRSSQSSKGKSSVVSGTSRPEKLALKKFIPSREKRGDFSEESSGSLEAMIDKTSARQQASPYSRHIHYSRRSGVSSNLSLSRYDSILSKKRKRSAGKTFQDDSSSIDSNEGSKKLQISDREDLAATETDGEDDAPIDFVDDDASVSSDVSTDMKLAKPFSPTFHKHYIEDVTDAAAIQSFSDYLYESFILSASPAIILQLLRKPPAGFHINLPVDEHGHTALHWAAATGYLDVANYCIKLGADIGQVSHVGHTSLMRAVLFSNNYDNRTFPELLRMLAETVALVDLEGRSVMHLAAETARTRGKIASSRYYIDCLLEFFKSGDASHVLVSRVNAKPPDHEVVDAGSVSYGLPDLHTMLNWQDARGDTVLHVAARIGNKIMVKRLQEAGADLAVRNMDGRSAGEMVRELELRNRGAGSGIGLGQDVEYDSPRRDLYRPSPVIVSSESARMALQRPQITNAIKPYRPLSLDTYSAIYGDSQKLVAAVETVCQTIEQRHREDMHSFDVQIRRVKEQTAIVRHEALHLEQYPTVSSLTNGDDDFSSISTTQENEYRRKVLQSLESDMASRISCYIASEDVSSLEDRMQDASAQEDVVEIKSMLEEWADLLIDNAMSHGNLATYRQLISLCVDLPEAELDGMVDGLLDSMGHDVEEEELGELDVGDMHSGIRLGQAEVNLS